MTYSVKNSAQSVTYTVNDNTENTNGTSLTLIGKNYSGYGLALNENFLYLLENFSNSPGNYPLNPISGQLFWDNTNKYMHVYDGTNWRVIYGALASLSVNTSISASTISASGTISANSTISAPTINAANIGNTGANLIGIVNTNSQPYINTVGTLTGLTSTGTILAPTINANVIGNTGSTHYGTIGTNAQPYITSLGTLTSLISSGNITASNHVATSGTYSSAYFYANGLAFQGGVTSVAAGANVTVSGTGSGPYTGAITINIPQSITTSATPTFAGINVTGAIVPTSNATINIGGTGTQYFNNVYAINFIGTSTTAKYADLAEKYLPDADYEVGTVMMVGGEAEITKHSGAKVRAIGVISAYPAYKMNSDLDGGVYVALKGRVPVKVVGPVTKGQALIGTAHGLAIAQTDDSQWMFAIALEDYSDTGIGLIEAVIL